MEETLDRRDPSRRDLSDFEPGLANFLSSHFDLYGLLTPGGHVAKLGGDIFNGTAIDPRSVEGQRFVETVFWQSDEKSPAVLEQMIALAAAGERRETTLPFRVSAGSLLPLRVAVSPYSDGGESFVLITGIKDLKPSYTRDPELLLAADNAGIGLWVWDQVSGHISATPRCNELLNIPIGDDLSADAFLNSVHPEDRAAADKFISEPPNGRRDNYLEEFRVVYADGRTEWISAEGTYIADDHGRPLKLMGALRRITDEKSAAFELAQVHDRETKAREEAVEANRAKDFFLAFVSHELRSPLNAILGWSKILLTKQVDEETRKSALQTIEKSARFQAKLIDDLVDSARVTSGKLKLEYRPANLYEIVNTSFQAQTPYAASHSIELDFVSDSDRIPIFGDAARLQQVFGNLLTNAIKFTPDGGKVSIDIRTENETAVVSVTDTGQGIDKEALPNIFRQFSQGDLSLARRNMGLGLGLSIVNILVAKHGGTVSAESEGIGLGAKFTVTIPLSVANEDRDESAGADFTRNPRPLRGINLLVVEDDADSREVLHLFLEQSGASVRSADSAKSAIEALKADGSLPDVIISDIAMPDEDGYTLMSKIRKLPAEIGGTIPALALSAFATAESKARAAEAGFTKYSTKPFEPDTLIANILEIYRPRPS